MNAIDATKPWILATGLSRGIGAALGKALGDTFSIASLERNPKGEWPIEFKWDLAKSCDDNNSKSLFEFLRKHQPVGFLHCAGVLGPLGVPPSDQQGAKAYWAKFDEAFAINTRSALELLHFVLPHFSKQHTPFVFHLSSGAAVKPYAGWDAYCTSKSAMLMAFQCLAKKYPANELLCLSVAPGTVMTDMMRNVLTSDPTLFPDVQKFKTLQTTGGLADPAVVAEKIATLLKSPADKLSRIHGELFDIRTGSL